MRARRGRLDRRRRRFSQKVSMTRAARRGEAPGGGEEKGALGWGAAEVLAEGVDDAGGAPRGAARGVRGDDRARVPPQRVALRERLGGGGGGAGRPEEGVVPRGRQ